MTRDELRTRAERIRARIAKTVEDIVDAGRELLAVKSSISRDQFIKWVEDEVGISQSTAYRWMSLTRRPSILRLRNLTPDLAYALTGEGRDAGDHRHRCEKDGGRRDRVSFRREGHGDRHQVQTPAGGGGAARESEVPHRISAAGARSRGGPGG
jgi:hypothetical protein